MQPYIYVTQMGPARKILKKYDEEIDGAKKTSFEIGEYYLKKLHFLL